MPSKSVVRAALQRRHLLGATAAALACPPLLAQVQASAPAPAFAMPRSLRLVVPFPAGGTADVLPRLVAEKLQALYPGGVVVDNRSGAGGNIGAEGVFRAPADGAVLLFAPPGPIAINQFLYPKLGYDANQWVPITVLATVPNVLAVSPKLPVTTLREFIAYARANPDKVTVASQGNGSTSHLTAHLFMSLTQTRMTHVPYKGTAPALVDLMGGQVDCFFDNIGSSAPQHEAGKLRVLAVADETRSSALPKVPTFIEAGLPGMVAVTWFAGVAPPGTPPAVVATLQKQIADALADAEVQRRFAEQGAVPRGWTPDRTATFFKAEREKWSQVIKAASVKVE
jgi:tripartite-type tricarboxylate transporter receptor subunit TctC